jgi:1-acyl-sn-glycerol-3-phosphate acyltransferase
MSLHLTPYNAIVFNYAYWRIKIGLPAELVLDTIHLKDPCPEVVVIKWQRRTRGLSEMLLSRYARKLVCDLEEGDIEAGMRYIVASNHQSRLDPFLVDAAIPRLVWEKLMPLRFFTANGLFLIPGLEWLMRRLGAFPARKNHPKFQSGLPSGVARIEAGKNLMIFPEGWRSLKGGREAKRGVEVIAHLENVRVIPVHLEWSASIYHRKVLSLHIGKPLDGSQMTAQEILDHCYDLPV